MLIHLLTNHADHFSHGKCGEDRADSESVQMSEDDAGHQCCYGKAGNVIADFDPGIFYLRDICQFSRKQVCRDDRKTAAVGKCDPDAQEQVADDKIKYPVSNGCRQDAIHISCTSSISLNANPTTKLKRYGATNFLHMIIRDNTRSPWKM